MTALKRRKVGKTKLEVTEIGLGGAPMGGFRATISDAEAVQLTNDGYDAGIRYFDTSPFYGYGRSELRMGAALREKPRDSYVLSTKIGRILHVRKPGEVLPKDFRENGLPGFVPQFDYTYDGVMRSLEHSHLRLGLDRIDIALVHDVDFWTIKDRALLDERFRTVMDSGFVRSTSCARPESSPPSASASTRATPVPASSRPATSTACCSPGATRCSNRGAGGVPAGMPKRNVSVILGGPYNSGILTGNVKDGATHDYVAAPQHLVDKAQKIEAVCQRHGVPPGGGGDAVPAVPSRLLLRHPRRSQRRRGTAERGPHGRQDPGELWSELKREKLLDPAAPTPN